jgi:alkaline phosphatase D
MGVSRAVGRAAAGFGLGAVLLAGPGSAGPPETRLHAGPMLGYGTEREVAVWVQTKGRATVQLRYFPEETPGGGRLTAPIETAPADDFVALFRLGPLVAGTRYGYELFIDGEAVPRPYRLGFRTQPLWRWQGPPIDFTLLVGSCLYLNQPPYDLPGRSFGSEPVILKPMAEAGADLMIWLGDNTYMRGHDWRSPSGLRARWRFDRGLPELQPLLASTYHYAIWDDHDYGPNDGDATYWLKDASLDAFRLYWPAIRYGLPETPGTFQQFTWSDVEFFLLDGRYYKKPIGWPAGDDKRMLGRAQMQWLKEALSASDARFKVIALGTQAMNPIGTGERFIHYPADRDELMGFIQAERIEGVLFLSGDRHRSEVIRVTPKGGYPLYDFTSSSLTAGTWSIQPTDPELHSPYRVPGTLLNEHSYGTLRFEGPRDDRRVVLRGFDKEGVQRFEHAIPRSELAFPD